MATFPNKNKVLASMSISSAILLILSTIAVCTFCACAYTKECKQSKTSSIHQNQQFSPAFKVDNFEDKDKVRTLDIVLYNDKGQVEKVYTPFIKEAKAACNGK